MGASSLARTPAPRGFVDDRLAQPGIGDVVNGKRRHTMPVPGSGAHALQIPITGGAARATIER